MSNPEAVVEELRGQAEIELSEREKFLKERMTGIGGSDTAAILGVSPWKSRLDVYLEKRGLIEPDEMNAPMEWGIILEEVVARHYADKTGRKIRRQRQMRRQPKFPWMIAHIDRLILNEAGNLEVKTTGGYNMDEWGDEGTDQVPDQYIIQCQHYMAVCEAPWWDLAVLIGGNQFRIYHIPRNDQLIAGIVAETQAFWQDHVEAGIQPSVDGSKSCTAALKLLYPEDSGIEIQATPEIDNLANQLRLCKSQLADNEKSKAELENALKAFIGEASVLIGPDWKVTWKKARDSQKFDAKGFQAAEPELVKPYMNTVPGSRRFLFKPTKVGDGK